jgi:hypothetical protein
MVMENSNVSAFDKLAPGLVIYMFTAEPGLLLYGKRPDKMFRCDGHGSKKKNY